MIRTALALALCASPALAGTKLPLTIGVNRAIGATEAQRAVELLPAALGEALGREVRVTLLDDYDSLVSGLLLGKIDLAWMSPLAYVKARQADATITAVAKAIRNGASFYRSVLVVAPSSQARAVGDLKGKKIAWVSEGSTSGYLFPRALLKGKGIDPDGFFAAQVMAGSHDAACAKVLAGEVDAAATFADEPPEGAEFVANGCAGVAGWEKLRIVLKTGPISNDVLAARPGFHPADAKDVARALASLGSRESGARALREAFRADGFGLADESDFAPVEQAAKIVESMAHGR